MPQLEEAMNRLEMAMRRLDQAAARYQDRSRMNHEQLSGELSVQRQTYELLRQEAGQVHHRLDHVIHKLRTVTVEV
jgi:hypothetical protein